MLRPAGPVCCVRGEKFPFASAVAGRNAASAIAPGNLLILKAHPAHRETNVLRGQGLSITKHPPVKAIAFTGSAAGGRALLRLAAERCQPFPYDAEMPSSHPYLYEEVFGPTTLLLHYGKTPIF
jgi:2,5-dioxopentanoate dehydrogenase